MTDKVTFCWNGCWIKDKPFAVYEKETFCSENCLKKYKRKTEKGPRNRPKYGVAGSIYG